MRKILPAATRRLPPSFATLTALGVWISAALVARLTLTLSLAAAALLVASLGLSLRADQLRRAALNLRFLSPMGFRTAVAVAEVMLPRDAVLTPEEVARSLDNQCMKLAKGPGKDIAQGLITLRFLPLMRARPPLDLMARAQRRRFLERRIEAVDAHKVREPLRVNPGSDDLVLGKACGDLGPLHFRINFFLLERHRRVLTRDEYLDRR